MSALLGEALVSVVAGGAGFVGSSLCRRLLEDGRIVVVMDNFCRGEERYLPAAQAVAGALKVIRADLSRREECSGAFAQAAALGHIAEVWHLAANSDIPAGVADSDVDLRDTFLTTSELLRSMQVHAVPALYFASSSAIYGDLGEQGLHESIGPLLPISNYGAMKLASEALISAAAESFLARACLFRFPNVVGVPATHGVILDFVRKLQSDPTVLHVLGDGSQRKAYLHVSDLIEAMLHVARRCDTGKIAPVNVGPVDKGVYVRWIAEQVIARVAPDAHLALGAGNRGWVGDVPRFHYSVERITGMGWSPRLDSAGAVLRAIGEIAHQEGC